MRAKLKAITNDSFFKNNGIAFVGSIAVAFLSYLYHPLLGRMMPATDFGEVQVLLSLVAQGGVFLGIFSTIVVNLVANRKEGDGSQRVILELYRIALFMSFLVFVGFLIFSSKLQQFFHFHSIYPFLSVGAAFLVTAPLMFRQAFLQAKHNFKTIAWLGVIGTAGRLIFALILVYLGFASFGAISAIVIAGILMLFYAYQKTKAVFKLKLVLKKTKSGRLKKELKFGLLVFAVNSFITFLYTTDILFVKRYFPAEEAGIYGGIATIAHAIFFLTGSVAGVLLPSIKINHSFKENQKILAKALALVLLLGGGSFLTFSLFFDTVISYSIGAKYLPLAHLLPRLSLVILVVSLINLFSVYFLALRKNFLIPIVILGTATIGGLSFFSHADLVSIINNFLIGSIQTLCLLVGLYFYYCFTNHESSTVFPSH